MAFLSPFVGAFQWYFYYSPEKSQRSNYVIVNSAKKVMGFENKLYF